LGIEAAVGFGGSAVAVAAGREILPHFRVALDIEDKGSLAGYDPVTVADQAAETLIRTEIARAYPGHGIRGEAAKPFETASGVIASITSSIRTN